MKIIVIVLLFILLFVSQINTILDIDLWWNLKTGEYILENFEVPRVDIFSYTLENKAWIDHEWLSQVFFQLIFSKFGWLGLNILKGSIIALCFFILLLLIYSKYKKLFFGVLCISLSILAFGYRSFLRPELFSYLFLCLFLYVLEREKKLYLTPFLQIAWVNLHGYFILGPVLVSLYLIGEFYSGNRDKAKTLGKILIWVVLASFINPYFHRGLLYPFRILLDTFTEQKLFMQNVHELRMPIAAEFFRYIFFWVFAVFASASFIINLKAAKLKHALIFAVSFLAAYMAVRNIPVFIFLGMYTASLNLNEAPLTKKISKERYYVIAILLFGLICFFASNKYYMFTNQFGMRKTESRFSPLFMPSGACDFLEQNDIKGRMFNTLDFGPYIGYRFYPERRIFIDTRTDLYKDEFYSIYRRAQNYPLEWRQVQEKYNFNIALLRHLFSGTENLIKYLYNNKDWRLVYYDENSCVFLKDVPEYRKLIDTFEINQKKRLQDRDININIAKFFQNIGALDLAEEIYIRLLEEDPKSLRAGNNLATIYINTGRFDEAEKLISRFLTYYPRSSELYANMGIIYLRLEKKDQALLMLEKSAKLDPYLRQSSYMLGLVYLERGSIDKAMRQFIKYSKLDPFNPEAHRILGDIYMQKGLLKKAEDEYNEADALEGKDVSVSQ